MIGTAAWRRRGAVLLTAGAVGAAGTLVALPQATAVNPCENRVTNLSLDSKQRFAGDGMLRRYTAEVNHPGSGAWRDQRSKVLVNSYPANAFPRVINAKMGGREKVGAMVKAQEQQALAAINGDFFPPVTIRGTSDIRLPAGIVIKNGKVVRASREKMRFVGLDVQGNPTAGAVGLRGNVAIAAGQAVDVMGVNWQTVKDGGVTVYTTDWREQTPRPKGVVEVVINRRNKVVQVRTNSKNSGQLGAPVKSGTRVLAYGSGASLVGAGANVDARADVNIKQATTSGVKVQNGIGRGLPLVEAGVAAPLGCGAYSENGNDSARPRTIVGWTANGTWRSITVPGTEFDGVGLRDGGFGLSNTAAIAKKVGLEYAYELDGGGSTTMYTRSSKGKWTRRDLYGLDTSTGTYERESVNGFAFVTP